MYFVGIPWFFHAIWSWVKPMLAKHAQDKAVFIDEGNGLAGLAEYVEPRWLLQRYGGEAVYTLDDVAAHSTPDDCWVVLYDGVYDITDFVKIHPGGAIILSVAGTDATDFFQELHKDEILDTVAAKYRIGDLG